MSTLKALRSRIRTVQSTQKITTAMKLVSAAKFRKAHEQLDFFRGYASALQNLWTTTTRDVETADFPKWLQSKGSNRLFVVIMADRGLCGSYNAAMVRHIKKVMQLERGDGTAKILPIGHKAVDLLKPEFGDYYLNILFPNRESKVKPAETTEKLAEYLGEHLQENSYEMVRIIYTKFVNVLRQDIEVIDLISSGDENKNATDGFPPLFEPSQELMIERLAPLYFKNQIRRALYEAATSEQAARMRAMETATENAKEVITKLKQTYNRTRQAGITRELIEIISGANALQA